MFTNAVVVRISRLLLLCLFAALLPSALACGQSPQFTEPADGSQNPGRGLRILQVHKDGKAERIGIQPMDLLARYGKFDIIDKSSYFKAREAYGGSGDRVEIEVWRGRARLKTFVLPGNLDIETNEYNPVAYQLDSLMQRLDAEGQIAEYMRDVEFKDRSDASKVIEQARNLVDAAERDGTLTRSQILVARIEMIPDHAPEQELKKQKDLISTFIATEPISYCGNLGVEFFERKHFRASIPLMKRYLTAYPDNLSLRLNLGVASFKIGLWDEADEAADNVLRNPENLSAHGLVVAYQNKMMAALSRSDLANSIVFAEKCFELEPNEFYSSAVLLAAAKTGDTEKFNATLRKFEQKLPKEYEKDKMQVDAAEALLLAKNNHDSAARGIVEKWKNVDRIEGRLKSYWGKYPIGDAIVDNWRRLAKQ